MSLQEPKELRDLSLAAVNGSDEAKKSYLELNEKYPISSEKVRLLTVVSERTAALLATVKALRERREGAPK